MPSQLCGSGHCSCTGKGGMGQFLSIEIVVLPRCSGDACLSQGL